MKTTIAETLVEWDDNKNRINIQKHGISFETAALVFADEERIEYYDELHSQDEDRFIVLGCVQGILYVVYTMRHGFGERMSLSEHPGACHAIFSFRASSSWTGMGL